jgi:hypothetical protein
MKRHCHNIERVPRVLGPETKLVCSGGSGQFGAKVEAATACWRKRSRMTRGLRRRDGVAWDMSKDSRQQVMVSSKDAFDMKEEAIVIPPRRWQVFSYAPLVRGEAGLGMRVCFDWRCGI